MWMRKKWKIKISLHLNIFLERNIILIECFIPKKFFSKKTSSPIHTKPPHTNPVLWCERWPQIRERQTLTMRGLCVRLLGRRMLRHWHPSFRRACAQMCGYMNMKEERECEEEREEEKGGEIRVRESLTQFLFSSLMLTFTSEPCKLLSLDAVMTCKGGRVCVRECGERQYWREREKRREREKKERRREREREEGDRGRGRGSAFSFLFTVPSFQDCVRFTLYLFLDWQWCHGNTIPFLFSLSVILNLSLFLQLNHTSTHTITLSFSLSHSLHSSLSRSLPSLCDYHFLCISSWIDVISHLLFQWVYISFIDCLSESGPKQKSEESDERERERVNGEVIGEREWENERVNGKGEEERREKGMRERILSFFFFLTFSPADTPSLGYQGRISRVCECTHQVWRWRGSQRCKEWENVWECLTEEEMCGNLCDLLTNVCLGVGVWPHMQSNVGFTYLISLLCSLSFSLTHTSGQWIYLFLWQIQSLRAC